MDIKGEGDRVDETTGFDHHDGEEEEEGWFKLTEGRLRLIGVGRKVEIDERWCGGGVGGGERRVLSAIFRR